MEYPTGYKLNVYHIGRREYPNVGLNAVLAAFAAGVAWGRFGPYHF